MISLVSVGMGTSRTWRRNKNKYMINTKMMTLIKFFRSLIWLKKDV